MVLDKNIFKNISYRTNLKSMVIIDKANKKMVCDIYIYIYIAGCDIICGRVIQKVKWKGRV